MRAVTVVENVRRKAGRTVAGVRTAYADGGGRAALSVLGLKAFQSVMWVVVAVQDLVVDRRYGIATRGTTEIEDAVGQRARHGDPYRYQAIAEGGFRAVVGAARVDPSTTTFVDLGAGRGRALVLAVETGFTSVVGVELDPVLAGETEENLRRVLGRRARRGLPPVEVEVVNDDVLRVALPDGPLLLFLYNPFGELTLRSLIARVLDSWRADPRPITLCYFNPVHGDAIVENASLEVTARSRWWLVGVVRPGGASDGAHRNLTD